MRHLLGVAVKFFQRVLAVDVLIGAPNHVFVELNHASGTHPKKEGEKYLLEKGIADHAKENSRISAILPESPLFGLQNVKPEEEIGHSMRHDAGQKASRSVSQKVV